MVTCLVCGEMHTEIIGDDVLLCYVNQASYHLFRRLKTRAELQKLPSPLCLNCAGEFKNFLEYQGPILAAQFLLYLAEKGARSQAVKHGLKKAKDGGKKLGRPKTIAADTILGYRRLGLSIRQIAVRAGISKSMVSKILQTESKP